MEQAHRCEACGAAVGTPSALIVTAVANLPVSTPETPSGQAPPGVRLLCVFTDPGPVRQREGTDKYQLSKRGLLLSWWVGWTS